MNSFSSVVAFTAPGRQPVDVTTEGVRMHGDRRSGVVNRVIRQDGAHQAAPAPLARRVDDLQITRDDDPLSDQRVRYAS